jgi:hypothetical protein
MKNLIKQYLRSREQRALSLQLDHLYKEQEAFRAREYVLTRRIAFLRSQDLQASIHNRVSRGW